MLIQIFSQFVIVLLILYLAVCTADNTL